MNSTRDGDSLIPNKELEGLFYTSEIIQLSLVSILLQFFKLNYFYYLFYFVLLFII